jgi:ABC-2 type transport system permease protein
MKGFRRIMSHAGRLYDNSLAVTKLEFRNIVRDKAVLLIFFGAVIAYPVLYSVAYSNEVVHDVPVAVVDQSNSPSSRQLVRMLDQTETVRIVEHLTGLEEAEAEFYRGKIHGIMLIPKDFEKKILRGDQAVVSAYCDASYFLLYKQVFKGASLAVGTMSAGVELKRFAAKGIAGSPALALRDPVPVISVPLFNPSGGYASYAMPGIFMIILQQTLLMGIGILGGTARERGSYRYLVSREIHGMGVAAILIGKVSPYFIMYAFHGIYMFGILFHVFNYPLRGNVLTLVYFLFSYLLAVIAMGFALSPLFRRRETAIVAFMAISLPAVMTAGFSWPAESMPAGIRFFAAFIPSTSGVSGFLKISQMGATLQDVRGDLAALWGLIFFYGSCATLVLTLILRHQRKHPVI